MIKNLNLYIKYFLPLSFIASVFYILIYNVLHYDPILGYDAEAHYAYIDTFSRYLPRRIKFLLQMKLESFLIHQLHMCFQR